LQVGLESYLQNSASRKGIENKWLEKWFGEGAGLR